MARLVMWRTSEVSAGNEATIHGMRNDIAFGIWRKVAEKRRKLKSSIASSVYDSHCHGLHWDLILSEDLKRTSLWCFLCIVALFRWGSASDLNCKISVNNFVSECIWREGVARPTALIWLKEALRKARLCSAGMRPSAEVPLEHASSRCTPRITYSQASTSKFSVQVVSCSIIIHIKGKYQACIEKLNRLMPNNLFVSKYMIRAAWKMVEFPKMPEKKSNANGGVNLAQEIN